MCGFLLHVCSCAQTAQTVRLGAYERRRADVHRYGILVLSGCHHTVVTLTSSLWCHRAVAITLLLGGPHCGGTLLLRYMVALLPWSLLNMAWDGDPSPTAGGNGEGGPPGV